MRIYKLSVLLLLFCLCACRELVVHDLSETEANKMMTQLINNALDVSKEKQPDGKWALSLPKEQTAEAIRFLTDHRMLKEEVSSLSQKSGLMASKEEQRFRYERALSHEIETTLANMRGVLQARVHLNLPLIDPIFGQNIDNSKSSASVMLVLGKEPIEKGEISSLVAGASGIPVSAISVITSIDSESIVTTHINNTMEVETKTNKPTPQVTVQPKKNIFSQIKYTSFLPDFRSWFAVIPWKWIGSALGLALMIVGVLRILNRHEKIVM